MNKNDSMRPWGFYENLTDSASHKVKRITVYPGKRLSLQSHMQRAEHWFVIEGNGRVTVGNKDIDLLPGQYVDIQIGDKHRIKNIGENNLVFIEIQTGDYFGEDDIERFEDDFGRV